MPDPKNINAWMGHCGGTDPYCQQGCSPNCANYTYMTGIETSNACKDPSADTLVGKFGNRGEGQPRVGQREVQEAMRKVQEGRTQSRTQSSLPQHQARFEGRTPTAFETSGIVDTKAVASTSSALTAGEKQSVMNNINLPSRNMVSSTRSTASEHAVEDEDVDAEYEVEGPQRCCWTHAPRRPLIPVQRREFWENPT